jgi:Tol biopolymer transport system component
MLTRHFVSRTASFLSGGVLVAATACTDAAAPLAPRPTASLGKVTPSGPNALPQRGRIVFRMVSADLFGVSDLYSINEDGSGLLRLTYTPSISESSPAASRDGKKIAYVANQLGMGEVAVMNADGSLGKTITKLGLQSSQYGRMDWSPDGKRIAIELQSASNESAIYLINASTGVAAQVTSFPGEEGSPSWSPDGSRLAFHMKDENGVRQIYTMKADGSDVTQFNSCPSDCIEPAWAPDGATIAIYHPAAANTFMVKVADPTLAAGAVNGRYAAWAPDAARLVFHPTASLGLSTASFSGAEVNPLISATLELLESTWLRK